MCRDRHHRAGEMPHDRHYPAIMVSVVSEQERCLFLITVITKSKSSSVSWTRAGGGFEKKMDFQQCEAARASGGGHETGQARRRFRPELGPEGDDVMADARLASTLPHSNYFPRGSLWSLRFFFFFNPTAANFSAIKN
ncbi:hypothetical protein L3X38_018218 [Prunus dulcis]|uniref:Uncharacterized protein n=1 Tax=Prunus dulcis TaxID=3755 RepID=A0AAD4ZAT5_PRUDU|nr:hypothetical protein L3X38_018218 [Prunus dulcis]